MRAGRKLVVKLWNAARFAMMQLDGFDPQAPRPNFVDRTPEDRWLLTELNSILPTVEQGMESYNYAVAREATDRFFWATFCDDYLEMVKDRFWNPERYEEADRDSARSTLWESLRILLSLYAPILPFVTEELYQRIYRPYEGTASLHITSWPEHRNDREGAIPEMAVVGGILRAVRALRTEQRISQTRQLQAVILDLDSAAEPTAAMVRSLERTLQAVGRAQEIRYDQAVADSELEGVRVGIVPVVVAETPATT